MQQLDITDPRVPAGWRAGDFVTGKLRAKSHQLEWDDGRLVLRSLRVGLQSYSYSPPDDGKPRKPGSAATPAQYIAPAIPRHELREHLRQYFEPCGEGMIRCLPLDSLHVQGKPVLCGYVSTWDTATGPRPEGRVIMRQGAFDGVLSDHTELLASHRSDLVSLADTTKGNLKLIADSVGLAFFADVGHWPLMGLSLAVCEAIQSGTWGMSFALREKSAERFVQNGSAYLEVTRVESLSEISATETPSNASTAVFAIQMQNEPGNWRRRAALERALER